MHIKLLQFINLYNIDALLLHSTNYPKNENLN